MRYYVVQTRMFPTIPTTTMARKHIANTKDAAPDSSRAYRPSHVYSLTS
jgi:hypothetical protein